MRACFESLRLAEDAEHGAVFVVFEEEACAFFFVNHCVIFLEPLCVFKHLGSKRFIRLLNSIQVDSSNSS
jgi:hypothetical protein